MNITRIAFDLIWHWYVALIYQHIHPIVQKLMKTGDWVGSPKVKWNWIVFFDIVYLKTRPGKSGESYGL